MIPILYPADSTSWWSNNGLGGLPDAISCIVTEQRNTAGGYWLEMDYPVDGLHFDLLAPERIIYAAPAMGQRPQPFRISRITRPINGIVHIEAPHISAQLQKITTVGTFTARSFTGVTYDFAQAARGFGQTFPFFFSSDKTFTETQISFPEPTPFMDILLGADGSILDTFGGEYEWNGREVILHDSRGVDSGLEIRYGVNMSDLEAETDATELVTACVPYWKGTVNEQDVIVTGDMCEADNADAYAYVRCVPLDVTEQFDLEQDQQPTAAQVTAKGQTFINSTSRKLLQTSIRVSYEPTTSGIGERRINLCDTVRVVYPDLNVSSISKVVETKFNTLTERYDELTIGTIRNNIVDTIAGLISGGVTYSGGGGSSGGGSTVSITPSLSSGTKIADFSIDGTSGSLYAPSGGGGGGAVDSVNGQTGVVVLDAEDVGALSDDTAIPTKTSDLTNDSGFITASDVPAQDVTSVNGQTGVVVLDADDVGALPDDAGVIRYDEAQTLTEGQKTQARENLGVSNASDKFDVYFGYSPNSETVRIANGYGTQVTGQTIKDRITVSHGGCILVVPDNEDENHFMIYDPDDYTTSGSIVFYRISDGYRYTITVPMNSNIGTKAKEALVDSGGGGDEPQQIDAVLYTPQNLTDSQKRVARRNLGMPGFAVPLWYELIDGQTVSGNLYRINPDGTHGSSPMTFSDLYKLYSDDKCFIFAYEDGGNVYKLKTISTSGLTLNMIDGSTEYLLTMNVGSEGTGSQIVGVNKTTVSIGGGTSAKYRVQLVESSGVYSLASGITPSTILSNIDNVVLVQNGFYELSGYFGSPPFFTVIFATVQVNASSGLDVTTFTINMDVSEDTCTIAKRTVTLTNSGGTATKADLTYTYNNTTNKVVSDLVGSVVTGDNIITAYSLYGGSPVVMRNGYYYHLFSASSAAVEFRRLDNTRKIIVDRWSTTASESAV